MPLSSWPKSISKDAPCEPSPGQPRGWWAGVGRGEGQGNPALWCNGRLSMGQRLGEM